ncbi:FAD-dependent oxidoreductase [Nocardia sp. NPDC050378]|uniref:NAD(P)/FAD-dependent oxidoreductase n=1 Tax=Nocardia sp. NPDC050378 TaxID=3155400 RepID=UPI0033C3F12E
MRPSEPFVVVGASLAGLRAVEEARAIGYSGQIILIGAEPHIPYDRPPLSKQFISPEALPDYLVQERDLRETLDVELRMSRKATSLDAESHTVTMADGSSVRYSKLLIATGASARTLPHLSGKDGVFTLRTLDDAREVRERLVPGANLVVIGAGFIGSEIASSAKRLGVDVVIVEAAPAPLVRALGSRVGKLASSLHTRNDVRLLLSADIIGLTGGESVEGVQLGSGEVLPADVVIVGIGAAPTTDWLRGSGIDLSPLDGGVICDEMLRTSAEDVFAAGDLVHWPNGAVDSTVMRLENWTNAAEQGRRAARNALSPDSPVAYTTVPYFWSDWYDHRIQFVGTAQADEVRIITDSEGADKWSALYRSGDRIVGAATLNEQRKIMKYRRMIAEGTSWQHALDAFPATALAPS